jgi:hypothetical protein
MHDGPHACTDVLAAHVLPHGWYPLLHANPHVPPLHVATAFAGGAGHTMHDGPHACTDVSAAHVLPHRWYPLLH